jgi:CheY-like chemotaxis protein/HPt (histidine-containing phosphotransfer) domain-containing protein
VSERGDAKKSVEMGINAYLTKPIRRDLLYNVLSRVVTMDMSKAAGGGEFITQYNVRETIKKEALILLADDSAINRQIASRHLRMAGYTVDEAEDGVFALTAFQKNKYNLVMMDVQMPRMDGYDAVRAMREIEKKENRPRTAIVAMTAHAMKDAFRKCIEAGMDDVLTKPIHKVNLFSMVEKWAQETGKAEKSPDGKIARPRREEKERSPAMDLAAALGELDNDREALRRIMESFLESAETRIFAIKGALADKNAEVVFNQAHTVKGEAASIFAQGLSRAAYELEKIGRSGDLDNAAPALAKLEEETGRLREFYERHITGKS